MRSRSLVPPMPREVTSASRTSWRKATESSARAARTRGSLMRMRRRILRSEQNHQLIAGAAHIAGAHGHDGIPRARLAKQVSDGILHGAEIEDVLVSGLANGVGQSFGGNPWNRR